MWLNLHRPDDCLLLLEAAIKRATRVCIFLMLPADVGSNRFSKIRRLR